MPKKILILNWRSPRSPLEGGAERFTLKYAQYWHSLGYAVTWVTNSYPGSKKNEVADGINYVYVGPALAGNFLSYFFFYPWYLLQSIFVIWGIIRKEKIDLVIDEIHGLPFFSPLFVRSRIVLLVCEVAGPIWDKMFPFPVNVIGRMLERAVYSLYRNAEIWAISESTRQGIAELLPDKKVGVIDLGFEYDKKIIERAEKSKRTSFPCALFLARLVQMKGIEAALKAVPEVVKYYPDFQLWIVGNGLASYEEKLHKLVDELQINAHILFLGYKDGFSKYQTLAQAHYLLHPSYREGFGLTLIEAGIVGTPSIIRTGSSMDALVKEGKNGFVFSTDAEIATTLKNAFSISNYEQISQQAKIMAQHYTWDKVLKRSGQITRL